MQSKYQSKNIKVYVDIPFIQTKTFVPIIINSPENKTILDLKTQISKKYGIPSKEILIKVYGHEKSNNDALSQCNIDHTCIIQCQKLLRKSNNPVNPLMSHQKHAVWNKNHHQQKNNVRKIPLCGEMQSCITESTLIKDNMYSEFDNDFNNPETLSNYNYELFKDPIYIDFDNKLGNKVLKEGPYEREEFDELLKNHDMALIEFYGQNHSQNNLDDHVSSAPEFRTGKGSILHASPYITKYSAQDIKGKATQYKTFIRNIKLFIKISYPNNFDGILNDEKKLSYIRNKFLNITKDADLDDNHIFEKIKNFNKEFQPIEDKQIKKETEFIHKKYYDGENVKKHSMRAQYAINYILGKKHTLCDVKKFISDQQSLVMNKTHDSYYGWTRCISHFFNSEASMNHKHWKRHDNDEYDQLLQDFQKITNNCMSQDAFKIFQNRYNSLLNNDRVEQLGICFGG